MPQSPVFLPGSSLHEVTLPLWRRLILAVGVCADHSRPRRYYSAASPAVKATPVIDNYFGTKIIDNYRWLEDAKSAETRAFIDAENAYTDRYLKQDRICPQMSWTISARWRRFPAGPCPIERDGNYYFHEAAGRRGAVLHLHSPRMDGQR